MIATESGTSESSSRSHDPNVYSWHLPQLDDSLTTTSCGSRSEHNSQTRTSKWNPKSHRELHDLDAKSVQTAVT